MNILEIIEKKRLKQELNYAELFFAFNSYLNNEIKDYQMSSLLMAICLNGLSFLETINLTDIFVKSGQSLDFSSAGIVVDKHSTGGVGDKVTLVLGPILASLNLKFPKMSGRGLGYTGGTIDKLESIPGFKTNLTNEEIVKQIRDIGISISSQTEYLVPLDKIIYDLRNASGSVSSVSLIAVSIMSKKIASGSKIILIDIKYGKGALLKTIVEAKELEKLMLQIANQYKIKLIIEINEMNNPLGDNIGNALEVIEALEILQGKQGNLTDLIIDFAAKIISITDQISLDKALFKVKETINNNSAYKKFMEMIEYQGGKIKELKVSSNVIEIKSNKSGVLKSIDAYNISKLVFDLGAGRLNKEDQINYGVGVILNKKIGEKINKDDNLMNIYTETNIKINLGDYFIIE